MDLVFLNWPNKNVKYIVLFKYNPFQKQKQNAPNCLFYGMVLGPHLFNLHKFFL